MLEWIIYVEAQPLGIILAGALGGLVRSLTLKEAWQASLTNIVVGGICALYLIPLVQPILLPVMKDFITEGSDASKFAAFMIGLGGGTVSGFVIDLWKFRARQNTGKTGNGGGNGS